jgi:hypothetical protein
MDCLHGAAWGWKNTDYARKLAAQQPMWVQGVSRTLTAMMAGEVPLIGTMFHSVNGPNKRRAGVLQYVTLSLPVYFHSSKRF